MLSFVLFTRAQCRLVITYNNDTDAAAQVVPPCIEANIFFSQGSLVLSSLVLIMSPISGTVRQILPVYLFLSLCKQLFRFTKDLDTERRDIQAFTPRPLEVCGIFYTVVLKLLLRNTDG